MKNIIKKILAKPMIVLIIVVLALYFPSALIREADSSRRLIVIALGIDKVGEEYEVSAMSFIPISTTTFQENNKIISAKDKTFINALKKIGLYSGKIISLPHTSVVVVNEEVQKDGLTECLDHLARTSNLGNNTILVGTNASAKEVLQLSNQLDSSSNLSLRDLLSYNHQYIYGNQSNIESFYRGYFSPTKTSILGYVKLDNQNGIDAQSSSSSGSSSGSQDSSNSSSNMSSQSSSSNKLDASSPTQFSENSSQSQSSTSQSQEASSDAQSQSKKILNDGSACVFKDGKLVLVLDSNLVTYYNWVESQENKNILKIENFSDENFDNATISFQIEDKPVIYKSSFVNGVPEMNYIINFIVTLDEVKQNEYTQHDYHLSQETFNEKMKQKIQNQVKEDFSKLLEVLREYQLDIIDVYKTFYLQDKDKFENFLNTLEDKEDYLRYVNFNIISNITIKA